MDSEVCIESTEQAMPYLLLMSSCAQSSVDSVYLARGVVLRGRPENPGRLLIQVELGHACLSGLGLAAPSHVLQHVISAHACNHNYMLKHIPGITPWSPSRYIRFGTLL